MAALRPNKPAAFPFILDPIPFTFSKAVPAAPFILDPTFLKVLPALPTTPFTPLNAFAAFVERTLLARVNLPIIVLRGPLRELPSNKSNKSSNNPPFSSPPPSFPSDCLPAEPRDIPFIASFKASGKSLDNSLKFVI